MKKFAALAMLLSAGLFSLGCDAGTTTQKDVNDQKKDVEHAQLEKQHDVQKEEMKGEHKVQKEQQKLEATEQEAAQDAAKNANKDNVPPADTTPAPANP